MRALAWYTTPLHETTHFTISNIVQYNTGYHSLFQTIFHTKRSLKKPQLVKYAKSKLKIHTSIIFSQVGIPITPIIRHTVWCSRLYLIEVTLLFFLRYQTFISVKIIHLRYLWFIQPIFHWLNGPIVIDTTKDLKDTIIYLCKM